MNDDNANDLSPVPIRGALVHNLQSAIWPLVVGVGVVHDAEPNEAINGLVVAVGMVLQRAGFVPDNETDEAAAAFAGAIFDMLRQGMEHECERKSERVAAAALARAGVVDMEPPSIDSSPGQAAPGDRTK